MTTRCTAVIFDMDGLLLDTERLALIELAGAAADLGYPWSAPLGLAMVGRNSRESNLLLAEAWGDAYPVAPFRARFNERYDRLINEATIPLKPGVIELLDWLDAHGLPCAVATSTRHDRAERKLAKAGLLHRMRHVVGGDQVERGKPAPDIFLAAAARLGHAPADCVVCEDSAPGVAGALAAAMQVFHVPDLGPPPAVDHHPRLHRLATLLEAPMLLASLLTPLSDEQAQ